MPNNEILIPHFIRGRIFERSYPDEALKDCDDAGFEAYDALQFSDLRINSPKDSSFWQKWHSTKSLKATGITKQGSKIVAYAHVPHYFCKNANIKKARNEGLVNGAGRMPQKEFDRIFGLDESSDESGNRLVSVVDHDSLMKWPSDYYGIDEPTKGHMKQYGGKIDGVDMIAINHPQTISFIGNKEKAESYLKMHKEVYGNKIGIGNSNDMSDTPLGRLLVFGDIDYYDLVGDDDLDGSARFVGVPKCAVGATRKIISPLEKLAGLGTDMGKGLIVVKEEDLLPETYKLLVKKQ